VTVLMLQKANNVQIVSTPIRGDALDDLLTKEWLLTNSRGGYASSTVVGCNTRGYHGLLIGSLNPPVNRIMALANCLEMLISGGKICKLSTFEFHDKFNPAGFAYMTRFSQDIGVHFEYELDGLALAKSVYLLRDTDTAAIEYDVIRIRKPVEFVLRPFVGLRDFHRLQRSYAELVCRALGDGLLVHHRTPDSCQLYLRCPNMKFANDPQWWFNFLYRNDRERGLNFTEDLWTPGFFKCSIQKPTKIVLWADLSQRCEPDQLEELRIDAVKDKLRRHQRSVLAAARAKEAGLQQLCLAADHFITKRQTGQDYRTTVLAGFPWFADWGRDAFVALPGLLLETGRFDEAKSVLTAFAQAADDGMVPNRFDDQSSTAYFNSVDASLWFSHAALEYLAFTHDLQTFTQQLLPIIRWIIDCYRKGTEFGIRVDSDGLVTAGNTETQLTWMDAKCDGVAFTPRCGKAVEVNALWHHDLRRLAQFYADRNRNNQHYYQSMADMAADSFCRLFWSETAGYLNDCILPDGSVDSSLRPNQIFSVSLAFAPPLTLQQQRSIVDSVKRELLTPYGLRTLNARHPDYKGTYTGSQRDRDEAYHQGTVWPYLIGPFVQAYLKVNQFDRKSKRQAAELIEPLLEHLTDQGCLGNVSEIFDGDPPHRPRGCIAQAWSVAELLRAYRLVTG